MAITKVSSGLISADASSIDLNIDAGTLYLDVSENRVGIGTTSPAYKLEVESSSDADLIQIQSTAGANNTVLRLGISGDVATLNASGGSTGSLAFKTYGTERMRIDSSGNVGITAAASLRFNGAGDNTHAVGYDSTVDGSFIRGQSGVRVLTGTGSGSERMRVNSTGVGIGTSSPARKLEVNTGSEGYVARFKGATSAIDIYAGNTGSFTGGLITTPTNIPLGFSTNTGTGSLIIDTSGSVGIGTTNPDSILHIEKPSGNNTYLQIKQTSIESWQVGMTASSTALSFLNSGTERMRIASNGRTSIGTTSTNAGLHVANADIRCSGAAVANDANSISLSQESGGGFLTARGPSTSSRGSISLNVSVSNGGNGIVGLKVNNDGSVTVAGALSKGSGSFKIDHPLESKKDTHHLVHSFIEGPQADNIYRGVVVLENGTATINLDTVSGMSEGTYVLLNTNTSCFTSNETDWDAVKGSVSGNILTISCQNSSSTATVSWLVIGERHDQHMIDTEWTDENGKVIVEPLKEETE